MRRVVCRLLGQLGQVCSFVFVHFVTSILDTLCHDAAVRHTNYRRKSVAVDAVLMARPVH